jgi:hypothetical protein
MIQLVLFIALASLWPRHDIVADAAPTPATSSAPAAMAPAPLPTIKPLQWQGITLGESIDAVRARMGAPDFNRKVILGSMLVEYPIHGGEGSLVLETTDKQVTSIRVEAAAPKQLSLPIGDPFGVNLGDSVTRLLTIRGEPTRMYDDGPEDSSTIFGGPDDNRWVYSVHNSVIVAITLIAPKPALPVGPPGRPPLVLHGTPPPPPHHVAVIHGTPAPSSHTPAPSGTAMPQATSSPTPVPGIALATPNPSPGPPRPTPAPNSSPVAAATTPPSVPVAPAGAQTAAPNATLKPGAAAGTPTPQPADGSSIETAIIVRAPDMASGFDYMYKFVENVSCADGASQYRITGQDITSEHRHNYAKVTAECPTTHDRRAFYFDVTAVFTKSTDR